MVYVAATFVIVLALVLGLHWVMIGRPEALERGKLHKRLRTSLGQGPAKRIDFVKQVEKLSAVKGLDVVLAHTSGVTSSLQRLIARADMQVTVGQLVMTSACLFLGAWLLVAWSIRLPWLGLANIAYARHDLGTAQRLYEQALVRDPRDIAARNNRAETLLRLGCPAAAAREIASAQDAARGSALESAVAETAGRIAAATAADTAGCPVEE